MESDVLTHISHADLYAIGACEDGVHEAWVALGCPTVVSVEDVLASIPGTDSRYAVIAARLNGYGCGDGEGDGFGYGGYGGYGNGDGDGYGSDGDGDGDGKGDGDGYGNGGYRG